MRGTPPWLRTLGWRGLAGFARSLHFTMSGATASLPSSAAPARSSNSLNRAASRWAAFSGWEMAKAWICPRERASRDCGAARRPKRSSKGGCCLDQIIEGLEGEFGRGATLRQPRQQWGAGLNVLYRIATQIQQRAEGTQAQSQRQGQAARHRADNGCQPFGKGSGLRGRGRGQTTGTQEADDVVGHRPNLATWTGRAAATRR